jgi:histidine ammonia-lyase
MAPIAARKARAVLGNVARIVACELVRGAQAIDFRAPLSPAAERPACRRGCAHASRASRPIARFGDAIESLALELLTARSIRSSCRTWE